MHWKIKAFAFIVYNVNNKQVMFLNIDQKLKINTSLYEILAASKVY